MLMRQRKQNYLLIDGSEVLNIASTIQVRVVFLIMQLKVARCKAGFLVNLNAEK